MFIEISLVFGKNFAIKVPLLPKTKKQHVLPANSEVIEDLK